MTTYQVTASHVAGYLQDKMPLTVSVRETTMNAEGDVGYYASAKHLGCGKTYEHPLVALAMLFSDHALTITHTKEI